MNPASSAPTEATATCSAVPAPGPCQQVVRRRVGRGGKAECRVAGRHGHERVPGGDVVAPVARPLRRRQIGERPCAIGGRLEELHAGLGQQQRLPVEHDRPPDAIAEPVHAGLRRQGEHRRTEHGRQQEHVARLVGARARVADDVPVDLPADGRRIQTLRGHGLSGDGQLQADCDTRQRRRAERAIEEPVELRQGSGDRILLNGRGEGGDRGLHLRCRRVNRNDQRRSGEEHPGNQLGKHIRDITPRVPRVSGSAPASAGASRAGGRYNRTGRIGPLSARPPAARRTPILLPARSAPAPARSILS